MKTGAVTFKQTLYITSAQPGLVSYGVCVLMEIQRIAEGNIESPRVQRADVAELALYRARWACEIMSTPEPTRSRSIRTPVSRRAARAPRHVETDDSDIEMGETRPPAGNRSATSSKQEDRAKRQPTGPREKGGNKLKRIGYDAHQRSGKRGRDTTSIRGRETGTTRGKPTAEPPQEAHQPRTAHAASGIPLQELAVGEKVPPDNPLVGRTQ